MSAEIPTLNRDVLNANRQALEEMAADLNPDELNTFQSLANDHDEQEAIAKRAALVANDQALLEMQPTLTADERETFQGLVDNTRSDHIATRYEVVDRSTGKHLIKVARSVGDQALKLPPSPEQAMAVSSESWKAKEQDR